MTLEDRIKQCIARHPDWDERRIASSIRGATILGVRAVKAGEPMPEPLRPAEAAETSGAKFNPSVTLVSVSDIKQKYDMFGAIMDIIRALPPGKVIMEADLKASIDHPDPYRFKKTLEAHEKELEPFRIMVKPLRGSEPRWHYGRPDIIADLRRAVETP